MLTRKRSPRVSTTEDVSDTHQTALQRLVASQPEWFPLELTGRYRGKLIEARIELSGDVAYAGKSYRSPSSAASAARQDHGYTGSTGAQTNGWDFWRFVDDNGREWPLNALRDDSL